MKHAFKTEGEAENRQVRLEAGCYVRVVSVLDSVSV